MGLIFASLFTAFDFLSRVGRRFHSSTDSVLSCPHTDVYWAEVMKNITLPIVIEADSDGFFVSCPPLQGCYSQGETYEEAVDNI